MCTYLRLYVWLLTSFSPTLALFRCQSASKLQVRRVIVNQTSPKLIHGHPGARFETSQFIYTGHTMTIWPSTDITSDLTDHAFKKKKRSRQRQPPPLNSSLRSRNGAALFYWWTKINTQPRQPRRVASVQSYSGLHAEQRVHFQKPKVEVSLWCPRRLIDPNDTDTSSSRPPVDPGEALNSWDQGSLLTRSHFTQPKGPNTRNQ